MGRKRIVGHIDSDGEISEGVLYLRQPRAVNGFKEGWAAMAQLAAEEILSLDIGYEAVKVYLALFSNLDFENWVRVEHSKLAEKARLRSDCFSRGLKKLVDSGLVERGPQKTLRLNIMHCWKGSGKAHREAIFERNSKRFVMPPNDSEN